MENVVLAVICWALLSPIAVLVWGFVVFVVHSESIQRQLTKRRQQLIDSLRR